MCAMAAASRGTSLKDIHACSVYNAFAAKREYLTFSHWHSRCARPGVISALESDCQSRSL